MIYKTKERELHLMNKVYLPGVNESQIMKEDGFLSKPLANLLGFIRGGLFAKALVMISEDQQTLAKARRKKRGILTKSKAPESAELLKSTPLSPGPKLVKVSEPESAPINERGVGGRTAMQPEVVLIFVLARAFYPRCFGEQGYDRLRDSVSLRLSLAKYGYSYIPSRSSIHDNIKCLRGETLKLVNDALLQRCVSLGLDDFLYMVQDSTAIEADSAYPLDSALLDKLGHRTFGLLQKCITLTPVKGKISTKRLEHHLKRVHEIDFQINMLCSKERGKKAAAAKKKKQKEDKQKALELAASNEKLGEKQALSPNTGEQELAGEMPEPEETSLDLSEENADKQAPEEGKAKGQTKTPKKRKRRSKSIGNLRRERWKLYKKLAKHAEKAYASMEDIDHRIDALSMELPVAFALFTALTEFKDKVTTVQYRLKMISKEDYQDCEPELILSVSDKDAAIIEKGGREKTFGYRVNFACSGKGLVSTFYVEPGNNSDTEVFIPTIKQHIEATGVIPEIANSDSGYCSAKNLLDAQELGIKDVCFGGSKGKELHGEEEFYKTKNIEIRNKRSAVEADISHLKIDWDLRRFSVCGIERVKQELTIRIIGYNFNIFSRLLVAKQKLDAQAELAKVREAEKIAS